MWQAKKFDDLTNRELWGIYRARMSVFVEEQKIMYQDVDEVDLQAIHVFYEKDGQILAYGRAFAKDDSVLSFGRVLTVQEARGQGLGKELVQQLLAALTAHFGQETIEIEAQEHAVGLYERFGFQPVGEVFLEVGVRHLKMVKANQKS
ncbi:GNAT family N-acetyltransferase [Fructobacillus ficulneus]|uniref:Acetyltransferase, GNAT family n=1 Tax=Fructobacillus ficulneus TaxID=157463 RepID=A0A0K8MFU6_9LACO|nr:GNAT family N-acetyltransferase [Fructobacillus ficulneus]GAO99380.1 acetyltransferase, GNAT family [Fructobacillus ficulneus]